MNMNVLIKFLACIGIVIVFGLIEPLLPSYIPDWAVAILFMAGIGLMLKLWA